MRAGESARLESAQLEDSTGSSTATFRQGWFFSLCSRATYDEPTRATPQARHDRESDSVSGIRIPDPGA